MQWGPEADAKVRFVSLVPLHPSIIPLPIKILNFFGAARDSFVSLAPLVEFVFGVGGVWSFC